MEQLRAKALKIAKNTHKAYGYFRTPNVGKKKCLCAFGVLATAYGAEVVVYKNYIPGIEMREILRAFEIPDNVSLSSENDNTDKTTYQILKEVFAKHPKRWRRR